MGGGGGVGGVGGVGGAASTTHTTAAAAASSTFASYVGASCDRGTTSAATWILMYGTTSNSRQFLLIAPKGRSCSSTTVSW